MSFNATEFELLIAQIYRDLDAKVEHNKNIGGLQIDVYAVQNTPDGSVIRTAVECKAYSKPLGVDTSVEICQRFASLKSAGLIEKGVVVALSGFTQDARTLFEKSLIECFTPSDLQQKIADFTGYLNRLEEGHELPPGYIEVIKKGAFIPLSAHTESGANIESISDYIEDWLESNGQFLTLLGEYGSGKTTTCWNIAQRMASIYLRTHRTRIPVFIELKHFNQNFNLRTFLTDLFLNQQGINIRSYSTFEKLNREGRLLLIFDGFDEMTTNADPAVVFRYLDEILSLQQGRAKIILTCRTSFFKDQTDLERLQAGTDLYSLLHKHQGYHVIFLNGLTVEQLQHYLSCYYGKDWVEFFQELERRPDLRSIVERPILLNMMVNTIQSVYSLSNVNISKLYEKYTGIWINRDNWRCNLTPNQRSDISKTLAFEIVRQQSPQIHHKDLQNRIATYFEGSVTPQTLNQYAHEVRTCSFLRNDLQGFYSFVHRSFAEFFAAQYMLEHLEQGDYLILGEPVTVETLQFLSELISNNRDQFINYVWDILRTPPKDDRQHNERVRAVSIYILLQCKENLSGADLSHISLPDGADLTSAQLSSADCRGLKGFNIRFDEADLSSSLMEDAQLIQCSFRKSILTHAALKDADLSGSDLSTCDLRNTNLKGAMLQGIKLTSRDVADHMKAERLEEISNLHRRFCTTNEISVLIKELPEKKDRQRLKLLLNTIMHGDLKDSIDKLLDPVTMLEIELLATGRKLEEHFQAKFNKLQEGLEKSNEKKEQPLYLIKNEQKKRKMRQRQRALRLKQEYSFRYLNDLKNEIQSYISTSFGNNSVSRAIRPSVNGAIFAHCDGLTHQQREWLERNGATLREE